MFRQKMCYTSIYIYIYIYIYAVTLHWATKPIGSKSSKDITLVWLANHILYICLKAVEHRIG